MTKEDYRAFFVSCMDFLKLNYFCKIVGIQPSRISTFINGYDNCMSIEKLEALRSVILEHLSMFLNVV